jgi:hypothetical protein
MTGTRSLVAGRHDDEAFKSLDAISELCGIRRRGVAPKLD